jgi:hypothetical protein
MAFCMPWFPRLEHRTGEPRAPALARTVARRQHHSPSDCRRQNGVAADGRSPPGASVPLRQRCAVVVVLRGQRRSWTRDSLGRAVCERTPCGAHAPSFCDASSGQRRAAAPDLSLHAGSSVRELPCPRVPGTQEGGTPAAAATCPCVPMHADAQMPVVQVGRYQQRQKARELAMLNVHAANPIAAPSRLPKFRVRRPFRLDRHLARKPLSPTGPDRLHRSDV